MLPVREGVRQATVWHDRFSIGRVDEEAPDRERVEGRVVLTKRFVEGAQEARQLDAASRVLGPRAELLVRVWRVVRVERLRVDSVLLLGGRSRGVTSVEELLERHGDAVDRDLGAAM